MMAPKPHYISRPEPERLPKGKPVTVCIAAACNDGREVIIATDGMASYGEITADVDLPKLVVLGDWVFLYAGSSSHADLILEQMRIAAAKDADSLSREKIHSTVRGAYKQYFAQWSADRNLREYHMEMNDFLKNGREKFGDERFAELTRQMDADAGYFVTNF